ncbi:hypothetical protein G768_01573 [Escherichia coli HVH 107 (4-5860571)]|jgi:hypothetical protein|uniref:DUF6378 domain-containing protein n=1 Tax=Escherichia coli TaxID=562 RepID=UPI00038FF57A|nr:DUF6378 domain-containing protein [Escherichia coli]EQQ76886.1 hypothetical protein G768_01573 [Escherichia coli HVH 107 (4-5860571)]
MTKAADLLRLAAETIEQRGKQNGYDKKEEKSAPKIATIYNAKKGADLTTLDVWDLLICLKEARLEAILSNNSDPTDTLIDLISYNALKAEQILTEREEEQRKKQAVFDLPISGGIKLYSDISVPDPSIIPGKIIPTVKFNGEVANWLDLKFDRSECIHDKRYDPNGKGDN